jgi:hypothetical protein
MVEYMKTNNFGYSDITTKREVVLRPSPSLTPTAAPLAYDLRSPTPHSLLSPLHRLLSKPVTRRQFLQVLGFGIISVFGFSTIIHFLTGKRPSSKVVATTIAKSPTNYGHKA